MRGGRLVELWGGGNPERECGGGGKGEGGG